MEGWCSGECKERQNELSRGESKKYRIAGKGVQSSVDSMGPRGVTQLRTTPGKREGKTPHDSDPTPKAARGRYH